MTAVNIDLQEIRQITRGTTNRRDLFDRVLQQLVADTGADLGVIWNCDQQPFRPVVQHSTSDMTPLQMSKQKHDDLLNQVVDQRTMAIVRPAGGKEQNEPLVIMAPVGGIGQSLVELVVPFSGEFDQSAPFLKQLGEVCQLVSKSQVDLKSGEEKQANASPPVEDNRLFDVAAFSQFSTAIHQSIDGDLTHKNIANETRNLLDCDRVTVVTLHRGKFRVAAISGQPSVNRRSNTVRLLEDLARLCLKTETTLWYPEANTNALPKIEDALSEYLSLSASRSLVIHPIYETADQVVEDPDRIDTKKQRVIGGVIYEHCAHQWDEPSVSPKLELTTLQSGNAMRNSWNHRQLFLYGLWRTLGKSRLLTTPRLLPKALLVLCGIAAVVLFLVFYRVPFYVPATGVLVPAEIRGVFPSIEGEVASVKVKHGQKVTAGDTLVQLRSDELRLRITETDGRLNALRQRAAATESQSFDSFGESNEKAENSLDSINAEIQSLQRQKEILQQMAGELVVKAPCDGSVITWDVEQKLVGRTVAPTQRIMEVADIAGQWEVLLDVDDRRVGHLMRGIDASADRPLSVRFTMAADPNQVYEGQIVETSRAMRLSGEHEQQFRVRVNFDESDLSLKQTRSGVTAKIYCGYETSIGYLWLHEVPAAFRRYVLFYVTE